MMPHKNGTVPERATVRLTNEAHKRAKDISNAEGTTVQAVVERAILGQDTPSTDTVYKWPLSADVSAEVKFVGPIKAEHLELMKRYLDLAKGALGPKPKGA